MRISCLLACFFLLALLCACAAPEAALPEPPAAQVQSPEEPPAPVEPPVEPIIEEEPEENSSEVTGIALPVESSALLYVNQRLGFTIEFPVEWAGLIQLEEEYDLPHQNGGNCITIYHRETLEKEGHGALFYIDCYPGVWAEDDRPVMAGASRRALQTEDFAVFVRAPSGVEFSESDEALAARYQALSSQMEYLATHIKEIE